MIGGVQARLRALYGAVPDDSGVIHVTAVWRAPSGPPRVLRIGPATPRSDTDFLVLNAARARAGAIVTSGRVLREEPGVTHALQGPDAVVRDLERWRRDELGLEAAPLSAVLTSGRELDLDHPLLASGRALLFVPEEAVAALRARARARGRAVEVVGHPAPDVRALVAWLREFRDVHTVSIEAGPTTARELYRSPLAVDELLLSVFEGASLPAGVEGPPFLSGAELARLLPRATPPVQVAEPDGPWSFTRLRRASPAPQAPRPPGSAAASR